MEVKTCEEYVLDRLERAENDVEALQVDVMYKDEKIEELEEELTELKSFIRNHTSVRELDDGTRYINFESVWEKFEEDEFVYIENICNEDTENTEDEEEEN